MFQSFGCSCHSRAPTITVFCGYPSPGWMSSCGDKSNSLMDYYVFVGRSASVTRSSKGRWRASRARFDKELREKSRRLFCPISLERHIWVRRRIHSHLRGKTRSFTVSYKMKHLFIKIKYLEQFSLLQINPLIPQNCMKGLFRKIQIIHISPPPAKLLMLLKHHGPKYLIWQVQRDINQVWAKSLRETVPVVFKKL